MVLLIFVIVIYCKQYGIHDVFNSPPFGIYWFGIILCSIIFDILVGTYSCFMSVHHRRNYLAFIIIHPILLAIHMGNVIWLIVRNFNPGENYSDQPDWLYYVSFIGIYSIGIGNGIAWKFSQKKHHRIYVTNISHLQKKGLIGSTKNIAINSANISNDVNSSLTQSGGFTLVMSKEHSKTKSIK